MNILIVDIHGNRYFINTGCITNIHHNSLLSDEDNKLYGIVINGEDEIFVNEQDLKKIKIKCLN